MKERPDMKKLIPLLVLVSGFACFGQSTARPKVADTVMVESAGGLASLMGVLAGKKTFVLAVEAGSPKTAVWLEQLKSTQAATARGSVVVLLAYLPPQQAAADRLIQASPGIRFVKDPGLKAVRELKLPGLPAMLGIAPDGTIGWQQMGDLPGTRSVVDVADSWMKSGAVKP
jgi:hypothetical protein